MAGVGGGKAICSTGEQSFCSVISDLVSKGALTSEQSYRLRFSRCQVNAENVGTNTIPSLTRISNADEKAHGESG